MNKAKSDNSTEEFLQAWNDVNNIINNTGQIAGLANSIINAGIALKEYQEVQNQLVVVLIQREMIMRKFDSLENFIRLAYKERATILKDAEKLIKSGLKRKKQADVLTGLQIIRAVLLTNPLNKEAFCNDYDTIYELLNSTIV